MSIAIGAGIGAMVGMIIANYTYQAFTDQDWIKAFEISFYQAFAVLATVAPVCIHYATI